MSVRCVKCGVKMASDNRHGECWSCRVRKCAVCGKEFVYQRSDQSRCADHRTVTDIEAYKLKMNVGAVDLRRHTLGISRLPVLFALAVVCAVVMSLADGWKIP